MRHLALVTISISLVVVFSSSTVDAEQAAGTSSRAEAGRRFDRGVQLFRAHNFDAALAEFLRAYEIAPNFVVLYNIGQVYAQLGRNPDAVRAFEQFLARGGQRIRAAQRAEVQAELQRLSQLVARIEVTVHGPETATVLLDDTELGTFPLEEPLLVASGRHVIEARAEGFLPVRREVMIAGGEGASLELTLDRAAVPGAILVSVNVPGATIRLDGEEVGVSPLPEAVSASVGSHVVEVERPGYGAARVEVVVAAGSVAPAELTMAPDAEAGSGLVGSLEVEVSEEEAEVFVDGQPLAQGSIPAGRHLVEVRRAGFNDWSREVEVPAGQVARVEATLEPTAPYLERYQARAGRYRLAAWIVGGLSVAILGTALGFLAWNAGRNNDFETEEAFLDDEWSKPPDERTISETDLEERYDRNSELGEDLQTWNGIEWAVFGVGAATLVTSIILFAVGPSPNRYVQASLSPTPGGAMAGLTIRLP